PRWPVAPGNRTSALSGYRRSGVASPPLSIHLRSRDRTRAVRDPLDFTDSSPAGGACYETAIVPIGRGGGSPPDRQRLPKRYRRRVRNRSDSAGRAGRRETIPIFGKTQSARHHAGAVSRSTPAGRPVFDALHGRDADRIGRLHAGGPTGGEGFDS